MTSLPQTIKSDTYTKFLKIKIQFICANFLFVDDFLNGIIYFSQWYYKNRFIRWCSYYDFIYAICFSCWFLIVLITQPYKVVEFDLISGGLSLQVSLCDNFFVVEFYLFVGVFSHCFAS